MNEVKRYKVYIYGAGHAYNILSSYLHLYKEKIEVLGIVTTNHIPYRYIDGYKCILAEDANWELADYCIVAVEDWEEIRNKLVCYGVESKILRSHIFSIPNFDIDKYLNLKNSNISILSNYCLGGHIYREYGLKQMSPTINMFCSGMQYIEFLKHYKHYLSMDMVEEKNIRHVDGTLGLEEFWPHGTLDGKIEWVLNHDYIPGKSIENWNKRRKRVNYNNIVAIMTIQSDEEAYAFEEVDIEKKIGFYYKDLGLKHVLCVPEWPNISDVIEFDSHFPFYINNYMRDFVKGVPLIDWMKFLLGEKNFVRKW